MNDFLLQNLWWIIAISVTLIGGTVFLIDFLVSKKKASKTKISTNKNEYLYALGGKENIVSSSRSGSRIVVRLHDYKKIDRELLRSVGVTGFIEKSDKLTLVVKDRGEEIYNLIFSD